MPGLLIKEVPKKLHGRLKARAAAHHRSVSSEVLVILEEMLDERAGLPTAEALDHLRLKLRRRLTQAFVDNAKRAGRP